MLKKPAILGGKPITKQVVPFVRPMVPKLDELEESYRQAMDSRMVTTGPNAELLGTTAAELLGVDHAIAVSSCTAGLLLATQALNLPPGSEVIMPSFTFMATALGAV